jgi:hypothetical protein
VAPRALSLLVSLLETSSGRVVEDTLDSSDRDAFEVLRDTGALVAGEDVPLILCPACGDQDVAPRRIGGVLQGLCPDCGYVPITNASLKAWAFDPSWLLGRLRMAFGIAARQDSEELVPGTLWKVGDHKAGKRSHRIAPGPPPIRTCRPQGVQRGAAGQDRTRQRGDHQHDTDRRRW